MPEPRNIQTEYQLLTTPMETMPTHGFKQADVARLEPYIDEPILSDHGRSVALPQWIRKRILFIGIVIIIVLLCVCAIIVPLTVVNTHVENNEYDDNTDSGDDNNIDFDYYDGMFGQLDRYYFNRTNSNLYRLGFGAEIWNTGIEDAFFSFKVWDGATLLGWNWTYTQAGEFGFVEYTEDYIYNPGQSGYVPGTTVQYQLFVHPSGDYNDTGKLIDEQLI
eukprot:TRINITY_DN103_c1_g1_i1.p1 TRINITY_DN103_c1_g1~~TRINITY_DN103_c1_g1_i1.p1  ORF type:complete len:220 (-),score=11.32 TRINITY_DN103_c1_g1_i1:274-933(-)